MNNVFLIGNLTRDPELTETGSGTKICRFTIAVNRPYTDSDGGKITDFFKCTAWRNLAENIGRYTHKGNKIAVSGAVEINSYRDNNGDNRNDINISVKDVEFLTPKAADGLVSNNSVPAPIKANTALLDSFDDDGDIPF